VSVALHDHPPTADRPAVAFDDVRTVNERLLHG
jgi:hypothetical protein